MLVVVVVGSYLTLGHQALLRSLVTHYRLTASRLQLHVLTDSRTLITITVISGQILDRTWLQESDWFLTVWEEL